MLVSAGWFGPAVLGGLNVVMQHRLYGGEASPLREALFVSGDWLIYAFLTPAVFVIARRWPLERPHLVWRGMLHVFFSLLFCAAWAGAGTLLKAVLQPTALQDGVGLYFVSWLFITLPFGVAVYFAMVGIEHAVRYLAEARERETQVARLSEQLTSARFAALQAQLNPHFLFNTLNTITVLVREGNRSGAVRIVERLSDVLRRTLNRHRAQEVSLEQELALVQDYLAIEQARFSDRLRVSVDVDQDVLNAAVPSFALQHLVENAIRHGIARRSDPGHVTVSAHRDGEILVLAVEDDGPGMDEHAATPPGHGIENTRERLRARYGGRASLTIARRAAGGTIATLRIPFREVPLGSDV